eukprot:249500-Prymnesium_polylepis.1
MHDPGSRPLDRAFAAWRHAQGCTVLFSVSCCGAPTIGQKQKKSGPGSSDALHADQEHDPTL